MIKKVIKRHYIRAKKFNEFAPYLKMNLKKGDKILKSKLVELLNTLRKQTMGGALGWERAVMYIDLLERWGVVRKKNIFIQATMRIKRRAIEYEIIDPERIRNLEHDIIKEKAISGRTSARIKEFEKKILELARLGNTLRNIAKNPMILELVGVGFSLKSRVKEMKKRGLLTMPRRGFYITSEIGRTKLKEYNDLKIKEDENKEEMSTKSPEPSILNELKQVNEKLNEITQLLQILAATISGGGKIKEKNPTISEIARLVEKEYDLVESTIKDSIEDGKLDDNYFEILDDEMTRRTGSEIIKILSLNSESILVHFGKKGDGFWDPDSCEFKWKEEV